MLCVYEYLISRTQLTISFFPAGQKRSHYDDHYYSSNPSKSPRRSPSPSSYPRYQHSASSGDLIVLGLRYDIDEQELREYFQHYGEVDQVEVSSSSYH